MKRGFIKRILGVTFTFILAVSTAACGVTKTSEKKADKNSEVPDVVNIGVQTLITPELAARYEKVYEKYLGTKVNLVQFDSGADVNKAFSGKSVDIAAFGTSPAALGIATDLGFEVFWYYDIIGSAETLVARKDAGVKSIEDLKGKKVGTPFASTAHYSLLNALKNAGMKASDIELLDMQPDDIYAAWKRGDIDAAYVWNPVLGQLKSDNAVVITDSGELAKQGVVTADVGAVRTEFAKEYPDVVTNYVKAQLYALDEFDSDRDKTIKEIAQTAGISEDEAKDQVKDFTYPSGEDQITDEYLGTKDKKGQLAQTLKNTADFLVEQGSIKQAPELSVFENAVTGEFVEKALEQTK